MKKKICLGFTIAGLLFICAGVENIFAEYVSVPAAAFRGTTESTDYMIVTSPGFWYKGTPSHYVMKDLTKGKLVAPVYFPDFYNSVMEMRVKMFDVTNKGRVQVRLIRVDLDTGEWKEVFKLVSGQPDKPGIVTKTDRQGGFRNLDNAKYAWFLEADFNQAGQDLGLYSVRIKYQ